MATRLHDLPRGRPVPLGAMLATIPSLPRPILARLVASMIEHMDEQDGDVDLEPDDDRCVAGDDDVRGGASPGHRQWGGAPPGDDVDAEPVHAAAFDRDQSPRPVVRYDAPKRRRGTSSTGGAGVTNIGPLVPIEAR